MTISAKLAQKIISVFANGPGTEFINVLNDAGADGSGSFTTVDATTFQTDEGDSDIVITSTGSVASVVMDSASTTFGVAFYVTDALASLTMTGTTGGVNLNLTNNLADALSIKINSGADLLTFTTTTGATEVTPVAGLGSAGGFTTSPRNCHTGGVPAQATTAGTNAATNTAGTVYLAEVFVPNNCTVTGIAVFNGTAVAGNGKVMLYDSAGARVAISASTLMAGTTAYQLIPFTAPLVVKGPATYFVGTIYDDTAHDLRGHTIGSFAAGVDAGNTYGTESTYATVTLPTTFASTTGPIASLY